MDKFSRKHKYLPVTIWQNDSAEDETFVNSICKYFPHLQVLTVTITYLGVAKYYGDRVPVPPRSLLKCTRLPGVTYLWLLLDMSGVHATVQKLLCDDVLLSQGLDEDYGEHQSCS